MIKQVIHITSTLMSQDFLNSLLGIPYAIYNIVQVEQISLTTMEALIPEYKNYWPVCNKDD
jgi:hypothetical protein